MDQRTSHGLHLLKVLKSEPIASAGIAYPARPSGPQWFTASFPTWTACSGGRANVIATRRRSLLGDRVGAALTGARVSGALRVDDALRQVIIAQTLRAGIESS